VEVVVEDVPVADAGPDQYIMQGASAYLGGFRSTSSDPMTFEWDADTTYTKSIIYQSLSDVIVNPDSAVTTFYLTVSSPSGRCYTTDSVEVHVELVIRAWNSLSPNQDGHYDAWIIENLENYPDALVEVYNRWGNLVWQSKGYKIPWHGENFRNNQPLPIATYYYIIYPNGVEVNAPITGDVTIVK
jgi:gliding motility-associated-like protein